MKHFNFNNKMDLELILKRYRLLNNFYKKTYNALISKLYFFFLIVYVLLLIFFRYPP